MSESPENPDSTEKTKEERFLLAEYEALVDIDGSRNERLDRFLAMFVTLAAAPWALYVIIWKDNSGTPSFGTMPFPIAAVFVLIGVLGFGVAMMFVQMRFTIILYMRAMNSIRGYFSAKNIVGVLRLPTTGRVPPYYERGSYIQIALAGMALVNSGYVGLGVYYLTPWPARSCFRVWITVLLAVFCWFGHMIYYSYQARAR
jgi:hypothetical protein